MCNRYIARRIDLRRFKFKLKMPEFEEFTEKQSFDPSKEEPSASTKEPSKKNSPRSGGASAAHVLQFYEQRNEVQPTDQDLVIRVIDGQEYLDLLKWGLVPPFEPEPKVDYATFNAKSETIATTHAYKNAWAKRQRCLVPVEAFFEWKGQKHPKQKFRISVKGENQFCLAGIWERWERNGKMLESYTIVTTIANELVAEIHDKKRMPVILKPEDYDRWLRDTNDVTDLMTPYPADAMEAVPIASDRKPKKRDDGPDLFSSMN
jgi:putative SOS response-associated peptidase YedK